MHTPLAIMLAAAFLQAPATTTQTPAPDLTGLWEAKLRFGPDVRGPRVSPRCVLPDTVINALSLA